MCLIAYVPATRALSNEVFNNANRINPHGIGVMSSRGVEKFYGNKQLKRAKAYVDTLVAAGLPHAVHWRFATHGSKGIELCHPFKLPNVDVYFMHNGVISSTAGQSTDKESDTLLYVNKMVDAPATSDDLTYWTKVGTEIGSNNKGLIMYPDGKFIILNRDHGTTIDGIWYSNSYSLPYSLRPNQGYYTPSRLRPQPTPVVYDRAPGFYGRGSNNHSGYSTGPVGFLIYWSESQQAYGYWENEKFVRLKVTKEEEPSAPTTITIDGAVVEEAPRGESLDERKCPLCLRYKINPPMGFLPCWCPPERLEAYRLDQEDQKAKAKAIAEEEAAKLHTAAPDGKIPGPGGPTLGEETIPPAAPKALCDHGNDNWENCRDCIAELEADGSSEVQRWLALRHGHHWKLREPNVIYLPLPEGHSEK